MSDFIEYAGSKLCYYKYGAGQKALLLFHGFGQDHTAFDTWCEVLKEDYTIYSFDLFFHGSSVWAGTDPLKKSDWKKMIELFMQKENIIEFELAGFSMGGKFVFATLESFPDQIRKVILVAPDGVKVNFWYKAATFPGLMNVFESLVKKPEPFFSFIKLLEAFGVIDKYLLKFALSQMDTEEKRTKVYSSWIYFRLLEFDMHNIGRLVNDRKTPIKIFVGKLDRVIPPGSMSDLVKLAKHSHREVLDVGHSDLVNKTIPYLKT